VSELDSGFITEKKWEVQWADRHVKMNGVVDGEFGIRLTNPFVRLANDFQTKWEVDERRQEQRILFHSVAAMHDHIAEIDRKTDGYVSRRSAYVEAIRFAGSDRVKGAEYHWLGRFPLDCDWTYAALPELLQSDFLKGETKAIADAMELVPPLLGDIHVTENRIRPQYGSDGEFDVDRHLSNRSPWRSIGRQYRPGRQPLILLVNPSIGWHVPAKLITQRAALIAVLVDCLESIGHPCEVWAMHVSDVLESNNVIISLSAGGRKYPYRISNEDQRKMETLDAARHRVILDEIQKMAIRQFLGCHTEVGVRLKQPGDVLSIKSMIRAISPITTRTLGHVIIKHTPLATTTSLLGGATVKDINLSRMRQVFGGAPIVSINLSEQDFHSAFENVIEFIKEI
jgi:hypothetical protein